MKQNPMIQYCINDHIVQQLSAQFLKANGVKGINKIKHASDSDYCLNHAGTDAFSFDNSDLPDHPKAEKVFHVTLWGSQQLSRLKA